MDKSRIKLMTRLAVYEKREEDRYLKIGSFYRRDYIGLTLMGNFFMTTIAYVLLIGLIFLANFDKMMKMLTNLDVQPLIMGAVIIYVIMLVFYTLITYIAASVRYAKAQKSIKSYKSALDKLESIYEEEDEGDDTVF